MREAVGGDRGWVWRLAGWLFVLAALALGGVYLTSMPGHSYSGPFQPLSDRELKIRENLSQHVSMLAGNIGERNIWRYPALSAAAGHIENALRGHGYEVASQVYQPSERALEVRNLEAEIRGAALPEEIVIVGTHYDSVFGSPGANDNGSGVAALIELARLLKGRKLLRTVRFVAFVNEEPPFYHTGDMGSVRYAKRSKQRSERIVAMLSLETIGYYSDAAGSQGYPFPLNFFYPGTGNFIGFVGNTGSRQLVRQAVQSFRASTDFPSEGGAIPGWIPGVDWSDHWSFWQEGYPALMVTDTALFRYPHYHSARDTPDKISYDHFARVVSGLASVIADLANAK